MERYSWYLVQDAKGVDQAVFDRRLTAAKDYAFSEGKGSVVITIADRGAQPDAGSELVYVAEEREYMLRDAVGRDLHHAPNQFRCIEAAKEFGVGTKVYMLGRDLVETGVVIFEAKG